MAEVHVAKTVSITLKLTLREAQLLKCMVQNPAIDEEPDEMRRFRESVWDNLKDVTPY